MSSVRGGCLSLPTRPLSGTGCENHTRQCRKMFSRTERFPRLGGRRLALSRGRGPKRRQELRSSWVKWKPTANGLVHWRPESVTLGLPGTLRMALPSSALTTPLRTALSDDGSEGSP